VTLVEGEMLLVTSLVEEVLLVTLLAGVEVEVKERSKVDAAVLGQVGIDGRMADHQTAYHTFAVEQQEGKKRPRC
jgi:hypothetical protein